LIYASKDAAFEGETQAKNPGRETVCAKQMNLLSLLSSAAPDDLNPFRIAE
jgi:hypothetical protein